MFTVLHCTQVHGTCANADTLLAIAASIHDADELLELAVAERDTVLAAAAARGASGLQELRDMQQRDARAELAATAAAAASSSSNSSGAAAVRHDATADSSDRGSNSNSKASRRDRETL
jgi:peptidoglycan hydrolase CwlO-like protein